MGRHDGTVAAITGGSQGLGFAIAKRLVEDGAQGIALCGRNEEKGEAAAREIEAMGAPCIFVRADMGVPEDCHAFIDATVDRFGKVTALVNCAAITTRGGLLDTDVDLWDEHMAINVRGPFLTTQRAVSYMVEGGYPGSIVNILSVAALCGQSFLTPYSASKGALATFTRNVANAFASKRIRCNGILVGWMNTPGEDGIQKRFHDADDDWLEKASAERPMGQLIEPDELAGLACYMLSPESGVMTGSLVDYDQVVFTAYLE